jgi:amino acid adenylation domain-containing protein
MLELPADHPDAERDSANGGFHAFRIPEDVIATVEQIAGDDGATLFMALLAAYQAWLARHTGQTDVLVGTPWAVRDRVELEPVIGYLTDTLVLRGDLTGDPTFRELLGRARRTVLDALTHHNVPFERLITELNLPRDTLRSPLLPTMLTLHSEGLPRARMGDLAVEFIDPGAHQAKFDLALEAWRDDDGLFCLLGYDATLFEADTIAALAVRFGLLLEGLAADPDRPVSAVPLLTDTDLAALSQPVMADPPTTVPAMFATTVAAAPDLVAIACGDEQITYAELNARAAGLAAVLRRRGVTAGSVVGVCLDRSIGTMAALLAIWRAGGAYLPLDPDYPDERLAFLIDDSGARVVLTGTGLADRLPASTDTLIVDVVDVGDTEDLPVVGPRDAAYVIYTSGSTGRPKGVVVEHGALADRIRWMRRAYDLGPGDRVVQFASLSFDAHAEEIYPALTAGAAVTLLPDGATSLPDVLRTPAGRTVTVLDLPTAYWQRLTEMLGDVAWPEALRLVILGGEQVHAAAVARWRVRFGDRVRLVNTYGPTEATIVATAVDLGERDAAERPPIGRPLAGTTAYVLDEHGRPVPPGTQGELCLGGAGLARGYLGRAALTAERFVPDPYGPPGARLYRTGDRVRWRRDGVLEFRGRLDDQVKVRGFRVEPGEVEARLRDHPGVGQAAVVATADALTAYVTGPATTEELRRHVAAALPPHLVPTTWVTLDALPLTVAGKVDVAALPAPDPVSAPVFVAPRTDAEELVVSVWAEVLVLEQHRIGALDDFFALGGHSLLATRMVALLRATLDVDVPIRTVFDHPSVAALAGAVEELLVEELSGLPEDEAARLVESP